MLLSAIYLGGAYGFAAYKGYGDAVTAAQIAWFVVYLVMAILIYGSLFIAIGAAASDLKDAQALMTPVHGALHDADVRVDADHPGARAARWPIVASLIPFATPMLMTLRLALTPAPTLWQIALGFVLALACTASLRLGRWPRLPHGHPDAGQERDLRRDVALGAGRLIARRRHPCRWVSGRTGAGGPPRRRRRELGPTTGRGIQGRRGRIATQVVGREDHRDVGEAGVRGQHEELLRHVVAHGEAADRHRVAVDHDVAAKAGAPVGGAATPVDRVRVVHAQGRGGSGCSG